MFQRNSKKKKLLKKAVSKPAFEVVSGITLLAAIEPLMMEYLPLAKDKEYTGWLLRCLRQELEKPRPSKLPNLVAKFNLGENYYLAQNGYNPQPIVDYDIGDELDD